MSHWENRRCKSNDFFFEREIVMDRSTKIFQLRGKQIWPFWKFIWPIRRDKLIYYLWYQWFSHWLTYYDRQKTSERTSSDCFALYLVYCLDSKGLTWVNLSLLIGYLSLSYHLFSFSAYLDRNDSIMCSKRSNWTGNSRASFPAGKILDFTNV